MLGVRLWFQLQCESHRLGFFKLVKTSCAVYVHELALLVNQSASSAALDVLLHHMENGLADRALFLCKALDES